MLLYITLLQISNLVLCAEFQITGNMVNSFSGNAFIENQDSIINAGGGSFGSVSNQINVVKIINIPYISTYTLSVARMYLATASLPKNNLYFFAGGNSVSPYKVYANIDIFNSTSNTLSTANLSSPRTQVTGLSFGNLNTVLFAGGYDSFGSMSDVVDIYNFNTNSYQGTFSSGWKVKYLPQKIGWNSGTTLQEEGVAFFSGYNISNICAKEIYTYNIVTDTWNTISIPTPRNYLTSSSLDNYGLVFFAGGICGSTYFNIVEILNYKTMKWSSNVMSQPRYGLSSSALLAGYVYFIGGTSALGPSSVIDIYNVNTNTFSVSKLQYPTQNPISLPINKFNIIYSTYNIGGPIQQSDGYGICTGGTFSTAYPTQCSPCPYQNYCSEYGTLPFPCSTTQYCGPNATAPSVCPAGTYSVFDKTGIAYCQKCSIGTYNYLANQLSSSVCVPCPLGFYCGEGSPFPQTCPKNYYCPSSTEIYPCPEGTYSDGFSSTSIDSCITCPLGHYCTGKGQPPITCTTGTFSSGLGQKSCNICPEGNFCTFGSVLPVICPKDTISMKGSGACTPCGAYQFTDGQGSTTCLTCASSYFNIKDWWCLTLYDKIIFVSIWVGSVFSAIATVWKVYYFISRRRKKLMDAGIKVSIYNIIFINKVIKNKMVLKSLLDTNKDKNMDSELNNDSTKEIEDLKIVVQNLQKEIGIHK